MFGLYCESEDSKVPLYASEYSHPAPRWSSFVKGWDYTEHPTVAMNKRLVISNRLELAGTPSIDLG
jgi:hypothetical protein